MRKRRTQIVNMKELTLKIMTVLLAPEIKGNRDGKEIIRPGIDLLTENRKNWEENTRGYGR
jgi:hypothetical protein